VVVDAAGLDAGRVGDLAQGRRRVAVVAEQARRVGQDLVAGRFDRRFEPVPTTARARRATALAASAARRRFDGAPFASAGVLCAGGRLRAAPADADGFGSGCARAPCGGSSPRTRRRWRPSALRHGGRKSGLRFSRNAATPSFDSAVLSYRLSACMPRLPMPRMWSVDAANERFAVASAVGSSPQSRRTRHRLRRRAGPPTDS
jgi:hypothetical protein